MFCEFRYRLIMFVVLFFHNISRFLFVNKWKKSITGYTRRGCVAVGFHVVKILRNRANSIISCDNVILRNNKFPISAGLSLITKCRQFQRIMCKNFEFQYLSTLSASLRRLVGVYTHPLGQWPLVFSSTEICISAVEKEIFKFFQSMSSQNSK